MSKVAYIVVGWNNQDLLAECFDSIKDQTYQDRLVIYIDNGSKDNSVQFVSSNYPETKIIQPGYNTGFAKGNNLGIEAALKDPGVDYVVLLNSDARLEPDWTKNLVNFSIKKPKGALFQGLTLDYYDHNIIDSTHIFVSQSGQGMQAGWRFYNSFQFGPKKVFGVNAAAALITRKFLEAQPFGREAFDERMFMYLEDVDLATRATVMGWDNYSVPNAIAYHMGSASSGKNPGFSLYMTFRNNSSMLFKNFPVRVLFKILPGLIRTDYETFRHLRRLGQKKNARRIVHARIAGLCYLPYYGLKRSKMKRCRAIDSEHLWKLMKKGY